MTSETKEMVIDNICCLLNNFLKCSAYENVIFCWVMHEQNIIDTIIKKIDISNCDVKCISLIVDKNHLRERLLVDVNNGLRNVEIVEKSIERISLYKKSGYN